MRGKSILVLSLVVLLLLAFSVASASSHHYSQLADAGWTCMPIPFGDPPDVEYWPHCFTPGSFPPAPGPSGQLPASIVVKVFDDIGEFGDLEGGGFYLGSEILIRADLYNNGQQPCMQDGGGPYHDLSGEGLPYFACHHFDTHAAG